MNKEFEFTGALHLNGSSAADVKGYIVLRVEPSGMRSWDGYFDVLKEHVSLPILPNGLLKLDDGREGQILTTNSTIGSSVYKFQGSGPLE